MAGEISVRAWLGFAKGGSASHLDSLVLSLTMTGTSFFRHRQTVGTVQEALVLGEFSPAEAYFLAINRDATNYVTFKPASSGVASAVALPGEVVLFRWERNVVAPFVQADTAAIQLDYLLIQK